MTSSSEAVSETPAVAMMTASARTRPFFWSVRRELWENRSIYLAPAIAAAVALAGIVIASINPHHAQVRASRSLPPDALLLIPYGIAIGAIVVTGALVGVFYCLGAHNGERRDRSILFWKSLPVSNVTTVASKVFTPMVVLPVFILATVIVTHLVTLAVQAAGMAAHGQSLAPLGDIPFLRVWLGIAWGLFATSLWWAPIYGWLLMVSAWAKRMTFLWGVGPPLAICLIERMSSGTDYAWRTLGARILSGIGVGFTTPPQGDQIRLPWPDPAPFLASPGLWIGLVVAAAFLAGAVWLRRRREPM